MKHFFLTLVLASAALFQSHTCGAEEPLKVLCIGNSFTYYHDSNLRLEEIAASQGHIIKTKACTKGGYSFKRQLISDKTISAIIYDQYDLVFLQDQSRTPALYGQDPKRCRLFAADAVELTERVRCYSPDAKIWIEQTWAYPNAGFESLEEFDRLLRKGTAMMARKAQTSVSPIGEAFAIARKERADIVLLDPKDDKHQSALGTYLKACVNYLLIFPEAFTDGVSDCGNDPEACAYLRSVAERVVLGGELGF